MDQELPERPPTIQDVAKRAGVSVATVSRVLNRSSKVRDATRAIVETAIAQLDYSPSWLARDLRQDRTGRVLVLFPSLHSPVMSEVFSGIDEVARANDYYPLICPTAKDHRRETELLALLSNRIVDGVIFFGTTLSADEINDLANRYSIVQCAEWLEGTNTSRVSIDDYRAARDVTDHLVSLGHRSFGMITDRAEFSGRLRERGLRDSLQCAGIPLEERFILEGDYEFSSGRALTRRLIASDRRPTALVCVSDVVAAGAVMEARSAGLRIPEDIAITGFDDSREALMTDPALTTIHQPFAEIGRRVMQIMLDQIADRNTVQRMQIQLPYKLVVRGSTVARILAPAGL